MLSDLADFANDADGALVLGVVLRPVERTLLVGRAAIDRCMAGRADLELGELVVFDLHRVVWVALALGLGFLGLLGGKSVMNRSSVALLVF